MTLFAYIDGACQGNPGESGYGIVFQDEDGNELSCHAGYIGQATNNIAEYMGLLGSLERVEKYKPNTFKIFSDSQLMVNQVNGFYKVTRSQINSLFIPEDLGLPDDKIIDVPTGIGNIVRNSSGAIGDISTLFQNDHFQFRHLPLCSTGRTHSGCIATYDDKSHMDSSSIFWLMDFRLF